MIKRRASVQDGDYPRPLLLREQWLDLDGPWDFAFDDEDRGLRDRWYRRTQVDDPFQQRIRVPFTFEAPLSGIDESAPHQVVWYRRTFALGVEPGWRAILHFGAVDHEARVWVDGALAVVHSGGQTAFSTDVTDLLTDDPAAVHVLVVRAADVLDEPDTPRGKQDWRLEPHEVWYRRATGISRTAWIETVPAQHISNLDWRPDPASGRVAATVWLSHEPEESTDVELVLDHNGRELARATVRATARRVELDLEIPALRNRQEAEALLWTPEHPVLVDAEVTLTEPEGAADTVWSYVGLRSVGVGNGAVLLNGRPCFLRSVLAQGYWSDGAWTAPSPGHLRAEVEATRSLGFNTVRLHQKVEDPRFFYWCDRLGVMVWAEIGAAYGFSVEAVERFTAEWTESVRQRRAHPSVVAWVPFNESWGVQDIASSNGQRDFVRGIASLTRALDPSRPVVSNDGWEHVDSDIVTIHDYAGDPQLLRRRYGTRESIGETLDGPGPAGRRIVLEERYPHAAAAPVVLSEFGGTAFAAAGTWGYSIVADDEQFAEALGGLLEAVNASPVLAGFCYTQLTDTAQEANGLLRDDRTPKLPVSRLRSMILGLEEGRP